MSTIRQTRLVVPQAAPNHVSRARLESRASELLDVPATIVRGAGGYGKTTLLTTWARALPKAVAIAWITFESSDATATGVIEAIAHSLGQIGDGLGAGALQLLERGIDRLDTLVAALSNELLAWTEEHEQHVTIFCDDVQFALEDQSAVAALGAFVGALAPRVHVVFATRVPLRFSPFAKLRSSGRVLEIDQDDLRFTLAEADELAGPAATPYYERTDGWPIAVGLLAQLLKRTPDQPERALSVTRESLFEFLADDVVGRLQTAAQSSLYALAVPDTIDASTAIDYLGAANVDALIEDLQQIGPYFSQVAPGTWKLHSLFREYLVHRLELDDPARLAGLRVRYADLLRKQGRRFEALDQILLSESYEEIVQYAADMFWSIRFTDRYRKFAEVMQRIPDPVFASFPELHRLYAISLRQAKREADAIDQFNQCYERAMAKGDFSLAVIAQIELGITVDDFFSLLRHEYIRSERHFLRALELSQRPELQSKPKAAMYAHWHLAMVYACRARFDLAQPHFDAAERIELQQENHRELVLVEYAEALGWSGLWHRALERAELAEELLVRDDCPYVGRAVLMQARARRALGERNEQTLALALRALDLLAQHNQHEELALAHAVLVQSALDLSPPDISRARHHVSEAKQWLERHPNRSHTFYVALAEYALVTLVEPPETISREARRLRLVAMANDDPWQQAMAMLAEADRLMNENVDRACDAFRLSEAQFVGVGDEYHAAFCRVAIAVCNALTERLAIDTLEELLRWLQRCSQFHVLRAVPSCADILLAYGLRNGLPKALIEPLVAAAGGQLDSVRAMLHSEDAHERGRVEALRVLSSADPRSSRALLQRFSFGAEGELRRAALELLSQLTPDIPDVFVQVVGPLTVRIGGESFDEQDERWTRRRSVEMLRMLAIARAPLTRDAVTAALWPENPSVLDTTFRVTLHLLRRALQPGIDGAGDYIGYDGNVVWLKSEFIAGTDADDAARALRDANLAFERGAVEEARERADIAIEVFERAPREESVEDWLRPRVRSWREGAVEALLLRAAIAKRLESSREELAFVERAYALDQLNEATVAQLFDVLLGVGRLEEARRVYGDYRRRLAEQLGTTPSPRLVERYARLVSRETDRSGTSLSQREQEVLVLVGRGRSNKEIAGELGLSVWTVNNHVAKILKKLNVQSRAAAVVAAGISADD